MTETFNPQANTVFCRKYKQELPKMPHPPFPNKKVRSYKRRYLTRRGKNGLSIRPC